MTAREGWRLTFLRRLNPGLDNLEPAETEPGWVLLIMLEEVLLGDEAAVEQLLLAPEPPPDVCASELGAEREVLRAARAKLGAILDGAPDVRARYDLVAEILRELIRPR